MNLSEEWRITSDRYNLILEHLVDVTKKDPVTKQDTGEKIPQWQVVGYYGNMEQIGRSIAIYLTKDKVGLETFAKFKAEYTKAVAAVTVTVVDSAGYGYLPRGDK